jgi:sterol desaturase/sphingolipid hydroxylase (fatty acid hydroxylase superfamily)
MITVITFLLAGIVTYYFWHVRRNERVSLGAFLRHCFPWDRLKSHSTKVDAALYIASRFTQKIIALASKAITVGVAAAAVHVMVATTHYHSPLKAGPGAMILLGLAIFICADFGDFLSHYLQHKIPLLWQFHKVHHSALFLTPLTQSRFHPVGNFMDGIFIGLFFALPASVAVFLYNFTLLKVLAIGGAVDLISTILLLKVLQHSHFNISFGWFERIFISPQMHQVHHSAKREHWDKNMANSLALWDWLFGTAFILPKGEKLVHGLGTVEDERGDYRSILWCYLGPLVACYAMLRKLVAPLRPHEAETTVPEIRAE